MSSFYSDMAAMAAQVRSLQKPGFLIPRASLVPKEINKPHKEIANQIAIPAQIIPEAQAVPVEIQNRIVTQSGGDLAAAIRLCERCSRSKTRSKAVPGTGPEKIVYLVIADAPSAEDDTMGLPFVGSTGQFFDKWLEAIGLSRYTDTYLTTLVKCRGLGQAAINAQEISACGPWLHEQIQQLQPKAILVLGDMAVSWFNPSGQKVDDLRKQVFYYEGIPWLATYHPAEVMRNPDLKRPVWEDLKTFKALSMGKLA